MSMNYKNPLIVNIVHVFMELARTLAVSLGSYCIKQFSWRSLVLIKTTRFAEDYLPLFRFIQAKLWCSERAFVLLKLFACTTSEVYCLIV